MTRILLWCFLAACSNVTAKPMPEPQAWQGPVLIINGDIEAKNVVDMAGLVEKSFEFKELRVVINSNGGMVDAGIALFEGFKTMSESGVKIRCIVTGRAMSAAFWILQACTERYSLTESKLMIHEPIAVFLPPKGNQSPLVLTIGALGDILAHLLVDRERMVTMIAPAMHMAPEEFKSKIEGRRWDMTPTEAIKAHALDSVWTDSLELFVRQQKQQVKTTK